MKNSHHTNRLDERKAQLAPLREIDDESIVPWVIEFRVIGTPHIIPAPSERQFIIGRADPEAGYVPEVDLTAYGAQAKGVSRRHAQMATANNRLTVCDLSSANGTFINGDRATPMVEHRLYHGDILSLGRLDLQVSFIVQPSSDERTRFGASELEGIERIANGQHVLIVDENLDVGRVIGFCARQSGFRVTIARSISEAVAAIDRALPDVLITEVLFEVGDGLHLIRYLREKAPSKRIPVVVITTTTGGYTAGQALQHGADFFVGKPLATDVLLKILKDVVPLLS